MNNCLDLYSMVDDKYASLVKIEDGKFNRFNVIKITIPSKMVDDFYRPNKYNVNAVHMVEDGFPYASVVFQDVAGILITYNIVKQG